jgi:uncharacterized membrane protein
MSERPISGSHVLHWLVGKWQWPYAGFFAAMFLLVLAPCWWATGGTVRFFVYLQLAVYMVHQLEEHYDDRFRRWMNQTMAGGKEALTPMAVFVINSAGVWVVDLISLYLAVFVELGWGLIAVYLTLINGILHLVGALVQRTYNPGLWTSIFLFLPVSGAGLWFVSTVPEANTNFQWIGLGVALGIHAVIVVYMKWRLRSLEQESAARG